MIASIVSGMLAGQVPAADVLYQSWPTADHGRVMSTPDWSDYRIYPPEALDKNQQGTVHAESLIGTDGVPKECRIVESSGHTELDAGTCKLFLQMRFEPARDENGKPIPSHFDSKVTWRFADPVPFASSTLNIKIQIKNHKVTSCAVQGGEGPSVQIWIVNACSFLEDTSYFFGGNTPNSARAALEVRLDAGDNSPILQAPRASGRSIAMQKISFTVSESGDPTGCVPLENHGFGVRGMRSLSPCGPFLATLYFESPFPAEKAQPRQGTIETRVLLLDRKD